MDRAVEPEAEAAVIGLVLAVLLAGAAFGALALAGTPRALWPVAGGALMLGAAGYAWQGRPQQAGSPARPEAEGVAVPAALTDLRERMMGRFTADAAFYTASDALLRAGDRDAAAQVMLGGVSSLPRSYMLWTGLGSTLAIHDGGQVSPASLLAFRQAIRLAPEHPAPWFYLGLAYLQAGEPERAKRLWRRALALCPPGASYRRDVAVLLAVLERAPERPR